MATDGGPHMNEYAHLANERTVAGPDQGAEFSGIQDVASQLGISHRTLRFYEDKGLIEPARVGNTRIYSRREVARMQLILRGKRLGFSIREIKEFLDLYDADPTQAEQLRLLMNRVSERIRLLEKQREAIDNTLVELRQIEAQARERLG